MIGNSKVKSSLQKSEIFLQFSRVSPKNPGFSGCVKTLTTTSCVRRKTCKGKKNGRPQTKLKPQTHQSDAKGANEIALNSRSDVARTLSQKLVKTIKSESRTVLFANHNHTNCHTYLPTYNPRHLAEQSSTSLQTNAQEVDK